MREYNNVKKYYDNYGSWYDDERIKGYYSFINDIELNAVKIYGKNKRILEIGCGTGIILNNVQKFAQKAYGIDLSSGMLQKARQKGLNVIQANAINLPFNDKEFDIVYSFKVLARIPEINKAINEMKRVTKDKGILILEFYNPYSFKYITNRIKRAGRKAYLEFYSLKKIRKLLGKDLRIIDIKGARIIIPFSQCLKIPILGKLILSIEKTLSDTIFNRFAGYLIIIAKKK